MFDWIWNWLKPKPKKKTYTIQTPDLIAFAFWILICSIFAYFVLRSNLSAKATALPILLFLPALVGIFVILFLLPIRVLMFFVTEVVLRIVLFEVPRNVSAETVVVVGKREYRRPSFWYSPNYDVDLILITDYLRMLGKSFSVYFNVTTDKLDEIMADPKIRTVYLLGHGRRHSFVIDSDTVVDYCRYQDPKYKKDFVYQIHCNNGNGKSLVEYVVPAENQKECLPEHGLMSNMTIYDMFVDKIVNLKSKGSVDSFLIRAKYAVITNAITVVIFAVWLYVLFSVVA